jgi:SAM-dependent methyltransferase
MPEEQALQPKPGTIDQVRQAYDAWSANYEEVVNETRDLNAAVLRQQPLGLEGKSILEIGAGTGLNTGWLAEKARFVVALDLSLRMLGRARTRTTESETIHFVQGDVTRPWPLRGPFDLIVANLILEHVPDLRPVFAEAGRLLSPGGLFYVCELHPYEQLQGLQARFDHPSTGQPVLVPAFAHPVSEYINFGLATGFALLEVGEWRVNEPTDTAPRLLSLRWKKC